MWTIYNENQPKEHKGKSFGQFWEYVYIANAKKQTKLSIFGWSFSVVCVLLLTEWEKMRWSEELVFFLVKDAETFIYNVLRCKILFLIFAEVSLRELQRWSRTFQMCILNSVLKHYIFRIFWLSLSAAFLYYDYSEVIEFTQPKFILFILKTTLIPKLFLSRGITIVVYPLFIFQLVLGNCSKEHLM